MTSVLSNNLQRISLKTKKLEFEGTDSISIDDALDVPMAERRLLATTSVSSDATRLCRQATRCLSGLELFEEHRKSDDSLLTHVVIGDERRTLKVLLGISTGAWFLEPQYISDSIEAGRWLPEETYLANVSFNAASARARRKLSAVRPRKLLDGEKIFLVSGRRSHASGWTTRSEAGLEQSLARVALALGASLVSEKECNTCIVLGRDQECHTTTMGLGTRCRRLRNVPKVKKEWLLSCAERYELLPKEDFLVA